MNTTHDIGTWFLLLSLVLPRITLFFWWLNNNLPYNTTPFWGDFFAAIFLPRILILVWIYDLQGMSGWFFIHLITMFLVVSFSSIRYSSNEK